MGQFKPGNVKAAKLTNEQVYDMRLKYSQGWTQRQLCEFFNCSINNVGRIVRGESRRGVPAVIPGDDVAASAARMMARLDAGSMGSEAVLDKLKAEINRLPQARAEKSLLELQNMDKAEKFGVTPEGEEDDT